MASRESLVAGLRELHLELLLPLEQHSRVLTAVLEPGYPNYSFTAMHDHLYAWWLMIYPGKIPPSVRFAWPASGRSTGRTS
jgi:2-aminoethylphosphonate-pyruvate transaminase